MGILLSARSKELQEVGIIKAASDKFLSCQFSITVYIHSLEYIICSSLRSVQFVSLIWSHHLVNGFHNFCHFKGIYPSVSIHIIHAEYMITEFCSISLRKTF